MDEIYLPLGLPKDPMVTDDRPKPEAPSFMDDPRPAEVLENVTGMQRHKGYWRRTFIDPVSTVIERFLFAARSIS